MVKIMDKEEILHIAKAFLRIVIRYPAVTSVIIIILSTLDHLGAFDRNDVFSGADYFPPVWLSIIVFPVFFVRFLLGFRKSASVYLTIFFIYFFHFSDGSVLASFNIEPSIPRNNADISASAVNVRYYSYGMENVITAIKEINADVVLISENELSPDEKERIDSISHPYYFIDGRPGGTAIMSKFPVVKHREIEFPSHQASLKSKNDIDKLKVNPKRTFIHAVVNTPQGIMNIISVRFIAGRAKNNSVKEQILWGKYIVETQQKEVDSLISYIEGLNGPVLFGGDLNAPPTSKTVKKLKKISKDAFNVKNNIGGFTFPVSFPVMRLDYIFTNDQLNMLYYDVLRINISDHLPVYAEFDLAEGKR